MLLAMKESQLLKYDEPQIDRVSKTRHEEEKLDIILIHHPYILLNMIFESEEH